MPGGPQKENGYTPIANELMDALVARRIPGEQMQCLLFVIRKTYGFNKKEDSIALSQFHEATGIQKPHIIRALKALIDNNIIVAKKGNRKGTTYRFNKLYTTWKSLPKKAKLPKKAISVAKKGNPSLPKKVPTKDNTTKDNITKEKIGYPVWLDLVLWKEYKKYRTKIKRPLTIHAEKLSLTALDELIKKGYSQADIVNATILSGKWTSFYPPKNTTNGTEELKPTTYAQAQDLERRKIARALVEDRDGPKDNTKRTRKAGGLLPAGEADS
ncbi:hypothetical protein CMI37_36735 [Candidatus Pacearchaeota archaeon]|nr:hypothetical protein [Candidatus Pacearchaeota archaeon]|tara:strand:+ start:818 stop:1630 length:813 start_codon:yes stop_codon:yes gene_type:complete